MKRLVIALSLTIIPCVTAAEWRTGTLPSNAGPYAAVTGFSVSDGHATGAVLSLACPGGRPVAMVEQGHPLPAGQVAGTVDAELSLNTDPPHRQYWLLGKDGRDIRIEDKWAVNLATVISRGSPVVRIRVAAPGRLPVGLVFDTQGASAALAPVATACKW